MLQEAAAAAAAAAKAAAEEALADGDNVGDDLDGPGGKIRFWRKDRELLPVAVHIRPPNSRPPNYLIPAESLRKVLHDRWLEGQHISRHVCFSLLRF